MVKIRGIQGKWRKSDMEYIQELENLKSEINKSGKRIENLSDLMQNFSDINNLRDALAKFQEDSVFARIESKIDIIAQTDSSEVINLIINDLNEDLSEKYSDLSSRIDSLENLNTQILGFLKNKNGQVGVSAEKLEDLSEIKEEVGFISSNYKNFLENLNNIQKLMTAFQENGLQSSRKEEFTDSIKDSLTQISNEEVADLEEKLDSVAGSLKILENTFLSNLSDIDSKITNINENISSINGIDGNFELVREKLDILTETLKQSGLENSEKVSNFNQDASALEARINAEISGGLNELRETMFGLHEEIGKISLAAEQNEDYSELREKLSYLISIVSELRGETDSVARVLEEGSEENIDRVLSSVKSLPQTEFISEKLSKLTDLFNQIKIRLDDENLEDEIKEGFSAVENNFERMEEILDNISTFGTVKEEISQLNENIEQIKQKMNDNSSTEEILGNLNLINADVNKIKETLPEKIIYSEIKEGFADLSGKVLEIYENLYPLQNLQTVNEGFISAQEKLNIIIENQNNNNIENFEKTLDLDARFNNIHSQIDIKVADNINAVNEQLAEILNMSEKIDSGVKYGSETGDLIKGDIKYLNLKTDNLKEILDRLIKLNGNSHEITENNFEEIKNALSYINQGITSVKESTDKKLDTDNFRESIETLANSLDYLKEQQGDKPEVNEFRDLLGSIREEMDSLKETVQEHSNTGEFQELFDSLNDRLDSIREQISDKPEVYEFMNLLGSIREEIEAVKNSQKETGISEEDFKESISALNSKLDSLSDQVNFAGDKPEVNEFRDLLSSIREEINSINTKVHEKMPLDEFQERLYDLQNLGTLNESFQSAQDKLNILVNFIEQYRPDVIKDELDLENRFNNIHFQIDTQVVKNLASLKECINEIKGGQNDTEEIKNAVNFFKYGLEEIAENLKYNIRNNIPEEVLQTLLNDIGSIKELTNNNSTNTQINEISSKITDLDAKISDLQEISQFRESIDFIKENLCQLDEKFNYTSEKISDFANFAEKRSNENISSVNEQLQSINEGLNFKIEQNAEILNRFLNEFTYKIDDLAKMSSEASASQSKTSSEVYSPQGNPEDINYLKEGLGILSESFSGVSDNLSALCDEVSCLKDIQEKVENINNRLEFASSKEELAEINSKIEFLTDEIKSYRGSLDLIQENSEKQDFSEILSKIDELNETIAANSVNTGLEKLDNIEEKVSSAKQELQSSFSLEFNSLGSSILEVKNRIENLNQSLDSLKDNNDTETFENNMESGIDEIKDLSRKVSKEVSLLKNSVSGVFEAVSSLSTDHDEDFDREKLAKAVERIELVLNDTKPDFDEIKGSSRILSEKIEDLNSDFLGLSEKTQNKLDKFLNLSQNLESKINDSSLNTDEILKSLNKISELGQNRHNATNESLDRLKDDFSSLNEDLSGFNNDITDVNSKINKLIINSNDNVGILKDKINKSFDNLKEDIKRNLETTSINLSRTNKSLNKELSGELFEIYKKVEGLKDLSLKGLNSSDMIRDAIIQMAEWIDSAGVLLEENNNNTKENLTNIKTVINNISDSRQEVLDELSKVSNKFENFEIRLESIEAKVERLDSGNNESETGNLLIEIKETIREASGKGNKNELVLDKIDKLETQMVLFETKIQRILDFIEQDKV